MELGTRRDQLAYFLGFVARTQGRALHEALDEISKHGDSASLPEKAFEHCPFNDGQVQILRSYMILEQGKRPDLALRIAGLLQEFIFLASDFQPPCCGDGRTFYERTSRGEIVLGCDRCGATYSLNGRPITEEIKKKIQKHEFIELFGENTARDWPFHMKLGEFLTELAEGTSRSFS